LPCCCNISQPMGQIAPRTGESFARSRGP
jgi:hypothetical protein